MRYLPVYLFLLGLAAFILTVVVAVYTLYSGVVSSIESPTLDVAYEFGEELRIEDIAVEANKNISLAIKFSMDYASLNESVDLEEGVSWDEFTFRYPYRYQVLDSRGQVIESGDGVLSDSHYSTQMELEELNHTSKTGRFILEKIEVDDSPISIIFTMDDDAIDQGYGKSPQFMVQDGLLGYLKYFFMGILLSITGLVFWLAALVVYIKTKVSSTNISEGEDAGDDRGLAAVIHLSSLAGWVIPFGSILLPLILWLSLRDKSMAIDKHGAEALNFNVTMFIYYLISFMLVFVLIGFLLVFIIVIMSFVLTVIAAIRASNGGFFHHPLTIRFFSASK